MNIFFLSSNPLACSLYHCDKHIVKMILEYAQLLSTAHHLLDSNPHPDLYRKTHVNHPCAKWVRESKQNYDWLYELFVECCNEYTMRYGKHHKTETKLKDILRNSPDKIPDVDEMTLPPKCMPDEYKTDCVVESYRNYYREGKKHIATWNKFTKKPNWY